MMDAILAVVLGVAIACALIARHTVRTCEGFAAAWFCFTMRSIHRGRLVHAHADWLIVAGMLRNANLWAHAAVPVNCALVAVRWARRRAKGGR